jgi:Phytanoyl-CoA dioxygenase (PhyH)
MWRLKRRRGGATALEDPPPEDFPGDDAELRAQIERLTAANRAARDGGTERRLLRLRHIAGARALDAADRTTARHPEPDAARLPAGPGLPELTPGDLEPALVRAAILRDGCALVRGLVAREDALDFAGEIARAFAERERRDAGGAAADGYYDEFAPHPRFLPVAERAWIKEGGGVLAADSPRLAFAMLELFERAQVPALVAGYLGEPALISVQKTTLRRAEPSVGGAWHQDGAFMGDVRSLNLWLALSRCGDEAPGLDLVPRRLDGLVATGTDEAVLSYQVSQRVAEEAAGDRPIVRPVFEPGDALFFDELFLHQTGSDPAMPHPRFAIENWFFGASSFPREFAPLAVA